MRRILLFLLSVAALIAPLHADPLADLAKYSAFPGADLNSLSSGKILSARGPTLGEARDLSVQVLYLVHAPVARTLSMHQQWDAGKHPELKVYIHRDLSGHPSLADFSQSLPGNGAVRRLEDATQKLPTIGDLQLSNAEAATFKSSGGNVPAFWSQVLLHRTTAFLQGGLSAQPAYDTADGPIRASQEVSRLIHEQPKVRALFSPVIEKSVLGGGTGSLPIGPYWELFDADNGAAFNLGASSSLTTGDSAQYLDLQYYASGGYYAYVTLYQMWGVTVNGQPATLVWRVDSISTQSVADLGPIDRIGSGAAMSREIERIVKFFQKDTGR